jgi:hypothetical protein
MKDANEAKVVSVRDAASEDRSRGGRSSKEARNTGPFNPKRQRVSYLSGLLTLKGMNAF